MKFNPKIKHQFGLIGFPLSHSFSKKYFNNKFEKEKKVDHHYELFPLDKIDLLPIFIKSKSNLKGLNITIPYKEKVIQYLDEIDEAAEKIGAVNTIKIVEGKLKGFNTDVYGFQKSLEPLLQNRVSFPNLKALILGTGGASKAIAFVLEKMKIPFLFVSRNSTKGDLTYKELNKQMMKDYHLIVNTTPLGMSPNILSLPKIPYQFIEEKHLLFDLVYNPEKTVFLAEGQKRKAAIKNGLEMLHLQAQKAWEIWTKKYD